MPNVMAALPTIGGALCSTPQSLADAQYWNAVQKRCQHAKPIEICRGAPNSPTGACLNLQSASLDIFPKASKEV